MPRKPSQKVSAPPKRDLSLLWRVRLAVSGLAIHCLSSTEPSAERDATGALVSLKWSPVSGTQDGDTVGFIDWRAVTAVSWRRA